jgi:hypothetical protein
MRLKRIAVDAMKGVATSVSERVGEDRKDIHALTLGATNPALEAMADRFLASIGGNNL